MHQPLAFVPHDLLGVPRARSVPKVDGADQREDQVQRGTDLDLLRRYGDLHHPAQPEAIPREILWRPADGS